MELIVDSNVFETFPGLYLGVVEAKGINNKGSSEELLRLLQMEQEQVRSSMNLETYQEHPHFVAWQEAYAKFGGKPKKYRSSVENLYRMTLEGINLRHINTLVDLYNVVSLRHKLPVGGDDLEHVDGNIRLTFATGEEPFVVLNTSSIDHPKPGEVIYRDDKEVLCRRWNWRECDKTKMTETTTHAILVVEGLPPVVRADVEASVQELAELTRTYCGGEARAHLLDANTHQVHL